MHSHIALLDRLAGVLVAVGALMAASGMFTLAFQASGIGFVTESLVALVAGSGLTAAGFAIAGRARSLEVQLSDFRRQLAAPERRPVVLPPARRAHTPSAPELTDRV